MFLIAGRNLTLIGSAAVSGRLTLPDAAGDIAVAANRSDIHSAAAPTVQIVVQHGKGSRFNSRDNE